MSPHHRFTRDTNTPRAGVVRQVLRIFTLPVFGILLIWGVLTKSLPFVFAETNPELALRLNPDNPVALIALAERERAKLLKLTEAREDAARALETTNSHANSGIGAAEAHAPAIRESGDALSEINEHRDKIISLARRAIANDPLNARGFSLLAEVSDTPEQTRLLMKEAVKRSRRDSIAVFWLLADSFARKDFVDVVEKAEVLLRTGSNLTPEAMVYLSELAAIPEGRAALVPALAKRPSWRPAFFQALPNIVQLAGTPYDLMIALKDSGSELAASELAPYLNALVRENLVPYAHDIWVQLDPDKDRRLPTLLNNAAFTQEPSGLPFDWMVQRGMNAMAEFAPAGDEAGGRSLRFSFGGGRVQFPELSQILTLAPGRYRLTGELAGMIRARRGLRWEIHCWKGKELAKTEMLYGLPNAPLQPFGLDVDIPDRDDCRSQQLRLFHDARSASEQLISGQASFRSLALTALEPTP